MYDAYLVSLSNWPFSIGIWKSLTATDDEEIKLLTNIKTNWEPTTGQADDFHMLHEELAGIMSFIEFYKNLMPEHSDRFYFTHERWLIPAEHTVHLTPDTWIIFICYNRGAKIYVMTFGVVCLNKLYKPTQCWIYSIILPLFIRAVQLIEQTTFPPTKQIVPHHIYS